MTARVVPPHLPTHGLMGNFGDFGEDTLDYLLRTRDLADVTSMKAGPFWVFILSHPDEIHRVLVTEHDKFQKTQVTKKVLATTLGNGLFVNDGESWKRQRRLTQPAFHTKRIGAYADIIADYAEATIDSWRDGQTVELDHAMTDLTMKVISKTLFDAEPDGDTREIGDLITVMLKELDDRFDRLVLLPDWIPTTSNRRILRSMRRLSEIIQKFIDDRRASNEDKGDLLSMLLMAQDDEGTGGMSDKQVFDEAMTLFGAGHETTAYLLTWTFYCLSQHPEIRARVYEEADRVLAGRLPTLADLPNMPYSEMVIKEVMRLYPPAWATTREALEDVVFRSYTLKKGEIALVNIYGVHRDARFFPQPEVFDPGRFSPANEKSIPKYAYLPFGGGPRVCIGNAFAMMEARLVLATVAQHFTLDLAPDQVVEPGRTFTLRPKYGMRMVAHARHVEPEAKFAALHTA